MWTAVMDSETARHVKEVVSAVATWWHAIGIVLMGLVSMFLFWLRHSFVTKTVLDEHARENSGEHQHITDKIDSMTEDISYIRGKIDGLHTSKDNDA